MPRGYSRKDPSPSGPEIVPHTPPPVNSTQQTPQGPNDIKQYFSQLSVKIDELIKRIDGRDILIKKLQEENMTLRPINAGMTSSCQVKDSITSSLLLTPAMG